MFIKQISIFVENSFGTAAETLDILSKANINISALSIADSSDYGIMHLIVDDTDTALKLLKDAGIMVKCNDVLAIPMADKPGGLSIILNILKTSNISIDYMYAFVGKQLENAIVVAKVDKNEEAVNALTASGITPLGVNEVF